MAHPLLQFVRERYAFRCGYCGVSETDVGGLLTIDHYRPLSAGGGDTAHNLVYSCIRCNQYKGAVLSLANDLRSEKHIFQPMHDNISEHISQDDATGMLRGLSPTGLFHIDVLRLNRPALIVNRQRRLLTTLLEARLEQALEENAALQERLARRELYIAYLQERLDGT